MTGNPSHLFFLTLLIISIIGIAVLFYALIIPNLVSHFYNAINIILFICFFLTVYNCLAVYFVEPGCIPRGHLEVDPDC